ncbi:MAG: hypothetical protein GF317_13630 [Candidatus Lokiarchaeota archaeon]|nr:hypothetical protein [Candidatus Lokiarchaeota archaeon]
MEKTKTEKAIDYLEIISQERDPNSRDVIRISKKVGCTERLVWRALRLYREQQKTNRRKFNLLKQLISDILFLEYFYTNLMSDDTIKASDMRRHDKIASRIEILQQKLHVDRYEDQKIELTPEVQQ